MTQPEAPDFHPAATWTRPVWLLAALLATLASLGPFAIDTYLPAFEGIAQGLATTPVHLQQTLSGYLLGFSVMMLFHGALSDSFGRRPVVFVGLAVFALASVVCATAGHVGVLIAGRVLQGMSCGAGIVVGRAIVRDLFAAVHAQKLMSQITLFFGVAPAIAPIIGGWLFDWFGWRSIFWFLALVASAVLVLAARTLPETLPPERRQPFTPLALSRGYWQVVSDKRFLLLTLAAGVPFNAMFVFILSAPMLLGHHLHLAPTQFFWLFCWGISGIMGGAWASGRLAGKISREKQVRWGFGILLAVSLANTLYHYAMPATVFSAILPVGLIGFGWSMLAPCVTLLVLDRFPARLGMASSLQACLASLSNAIVAGVIAPIAMASVAGLAFVSFLLAFAGWACWKGYRIDVRRGQRAAV
ncbi:multidrug effflux MFS transporter [Niveibacterium umoris]|uniref:Bcr/CflA family efflux transporter n=1 Tax=Niveibacterium umoris TaxID=1193620 RepID=A0A840BJT7_9RHOO|nr:multidrug effflux MFS transporter [Niveibacterium umoris]MBB4013515.1 DHA1 family bicyclomycin/chloramphenicol resistance-like MFS transporter [Niveibacterium umoris]